VTIVATPGDPTANSYVDVATADAYFVNRPAGSAWTALSTSAAKEPFLIYATRILETRVQWDGLRTNTTQALDWPRTGVIDPNYQDAKINGVGDLGYRLYQKVILNTVVPQDIQDACCEMALSLIVSDRSLDASSRGLKRAKVGSLEVEFDGSMAPPVLPRPVRDLLRPYGRFAGSGGSVELVRA
jgi:hypothetical protein